MANTKSAAKRARQSKHRTLNNSRAGTQVKSAKRKLRDLIKAGDIRQFAQSFDRITAGCNACHSTADQSFVVIKTPDASVFPNQEFEPGRR